MVSSESHVKDFEREELEDGEVCDADEVIDQLIDRIRGGDDIHEIVKDAWTLAPDKQRALVTAIETLLDDIRSDARSKVRADDVAFASSKAGTASQEAAGSAMFGLIRSAAPHFASITQYNTTLDAPYSTLEPTTAPFDRNSTAIGAKNDIALPLPLSLREAVTSPIERGKKQKRNDKDTLVSPMPENKRARHQTLPSNPRNPSPARSPFWAHSRSPRRTRAPPSRMRSPRPYLPLCEDPERPRCIFFRREDKHSCKRGQSCTFYHDISGPRHDSR